MLFRSRTNPSEKVDALHEKNRKSGIISTVPSYHGFNLDKKIVPTPIFTAISGEVIIDNIYYKGATVEVMTHLIEAGAKITPETLDGKSPYALVEKSCRTPKEKKEVIKYLKSIGVKDFGSKDVKQVKCKTDISEKGVYIYIDDKYSSK